MTRPTNVLLVAVGVALVLGQAPLAAAGPGTVETTDSVNTSATNTTGAVETTSTVNTTGTLDTTDTANTSGATETLDRTHLSDGTDLSGSVGTSATLSVDGTRSTTLSSDGTTGTLLPVSGDVDADVDAETESDVYRRLNGRQPMRSTTDDGPAHEPTVTDGRDRSSTTASRDARTGSHEQRRVPGRSPLPVPMTGVALVGAASAVGASASGAWRPVVRTARSGLTSLRRGEWREWPTRFLGLLGSHFHDDSDPLAHDTRAAVYHHVESAPGTYLSEISEATDVPLATVRYHLKVLRREGVVARTEIRGRQRYFPAGAEVSPLDAALADEAPAAVLRALAAHGPDSVSGLADTLERDPSTVSHHLDRLEDAGLVEREREGQAVVNRLAPAVEDALDGERVETSERTATAQD